MNRIIGFIVAALLMGVMAVYGIRPAGTLSRAEAQTMLTPVTLGAVTIHYTVTRIPGAASNQWAIWIENESGAHVKTLFVNDYTARRQGWKARPQMLITWRTVIGLDTMPQKEIDALSVATPRAGVQTAIWDLTDASGVPVAPGTYNYHIEGSLLWENTVLYTGTISVGGGATASQAAVRYFPEGAADLGRTMILDVSAEYTPGE